MRRFHKGEEGQTLVVLALSAIVLVAALALGIDWGYGLAQRRVMQDASDAAALAGARLLATNVLNTDQGLLFKVHREDVWCVANQYAEANRSFRPNGATEGVFVEGSADKISYVPFDPPTVACPPPGTLVTAGTLTPVPAGTRFIRVRSTVDYRSLLASAAGRPTINAAAIAVAQIVGVGVPGNGVIWPMARHYNSADFTEQCPPPGTPGPCDPTQASPVIFWSSSPGKQKDIVFGNFKGLIDYSRYSPNINRTSPPASQACSPLPDPSACVPQLLDKYDDTGLPPGGKDNLAGGSACNPPAPAGKWFTAGNENSQQYDKNCSVPNWTVYSFLGSLSLDANWYKSGAGGRHLAGQEKPDDSFKSLSGHRSVCSAVVDPLEAPSCDDPELGDWVEVSQSGDVGTNMAAAMRAYILAHPSYDVWQHTKTGPGKGAPEYGPYAIINIYLWDCAESFSAKGSPGDQFSLALPKGGSDKKDCSNIHDGNDTNGTIDRVHLFTVAPFTFYLGLVSSSSIEGFWGGVVLGDPGGCANDPGAPGCIINPFANAIFLVADD